MRIRGLAFVGLVIGAICTQTATAASAPRSAAQSTSVDRFFSSDAPESLHESLNQGTVDTPNEWHSEASGWLHAQLSENEREFLSLAVTGTIPTGCATTSTFSTTDATIAVQPTVKFNFPQNTVPSGFAYQFQSDVSNALLVQARIPGNGVSGTSANNIQIVANNANGYREYLVTFTILPPYNAADTSSTATTPAGALYNTFLAAFANSNSGLRNSVSFQNIDLSYCPTATAFAVTATPTTQTPTSTSTPTSTTAPTATAAPTTIRSATTAAGTTSTVGTTSTPTTTATATGSTSTTTSVPTTTASSTTSVPTGSVSTTTSLPTGTASTTTSVPTTTAGSATTAAGTTVVPTTKAASTTTAALFCPTHPAACLNGGTCVDGTNGAYTCTCGQGYIGQYCQFSLFPRAKGKKTMGASIPRGVSVARPAATKQFIKPNQA